jgi:hypothetical protein
MGALAIAGVGGNSGIVQRVGAGVALDPDAAAYIAAVQAADGQTLEPALVTAYNEFFTGCKADASPFPGVSNFDAIKASCIMAGARTLAGALVPLRGPAPTNFNFVAGDYDRTTGLKGNGVDKYLDCNRAGNADPQNNLHAAAWVTAAATMASAPRLLECGPYNLVGATILFEALGPNRWGMVNRRSSTSLLSTGVRNVPSFVGLGRETSSFALLRSRSTTLSFSTDSQPPPATNWLAYRASLLDSNPQLSDARIAYYSIGEAVDLAALDARVTTLQAAIAAALA